MEEDTACENIENNTIQSEDCKNKWKHDKDIQELLSTIHKDTGLDAETKETIGTDEMILDNTDFSTVNKCIVDNKTPVLDDNTNIPIDGSFNDLGSITPFDVIFSGANSHDRFAFENDDPSPSVWVKNEIIEAPVFTVAKHDSNQEEDNESDSSDSLPVITFRGRRRGSRGAREPAPLSVKSETHTDSHKRTNRTKIKVVKTCSGSEEDSADEDEGDSEDNATVSCKTQCGELFNRTDTHGQSKYPELFTDDGTTYLGHEFTSEPVEKDATLPEMKTSLEYPSKTEIKAETVHTSYSSCEYPTRDTMNTEVKEESEWLVTGYTHEPDVIFLSDDDDNDIINIMSFSQPVIALDIEDNMKVKAEQDSDCDMDTEAVSTAYASDIYLQDTQVDAEDDPSVFEYHSALFSEETEVADSDAGDVTVLRNNESNMQGTCIDNTKNRNLEKFIVKPTNVQSLEASPSKFATKTNDNIMGTQFNAKPNSSIDLHTDIDDDLVHLKELDDMQEKATSCNEKSDNCRVEDERKVKNVGHDVDMDRECESDTEKGITGNKRKISDRVECHEAFSIASPSAKKVRTHANTAKMIEPMKLKSTAEKMASAFAQTQGSSICSEKHVYTAKVNKTFRDQVQSSDSDNLVVRDVSAPKRSLLKKNSGKSNSRPGFYSERGRKGNVSMFPLKQTDLSAPLIMAKRQLSKRTNRGAVRPGDIADGPKKIEPSISGTNVEDVELPTGSQIVRLGVPLINDIGRIVIKKKEATPSCLRKTTTTPGSTTSSASTSARGTSSITSRISSASMSAREGQSRPGKSVKFSDTLQSTVQSSSTQVKSVGNLPPTSIRQDTSLGNGTEKNRGKAVQTIKTSVTETNVKKTISSGVRSRKPPASTGINPARPLAQISIPPSRATQPPILRPPIETLPASLSNKPSISVWEDFLKDVLKCSPKWFEEAGTNMEDVELPTDIQIVRLPLINDIGRIVIKKNKATPSCQGKPSKTQGSSVEVRQKTTNASGSTTVATAALTRKTTPSSTTSASASSSLSSRTLASTIGSAKTLSQAQGSAPSSASSSARGGVTSYTSTISSASMSARESVAMPHSNLSSSVPTTSSITSATSSVHMLVKHPSVPTTTSTISSTSMLAMEYVAKPHSNLSGSVPTTSSITSATSSVIMSVKHHSVPTTSSITSTISPASMSARGGQSESGKPMLAMEYVAKPHSILSSSVPTTSSIKSATSSVFMSVKHPSVPTTSSITSTISSASMLASEGVAKPHSNVSNNVPSTSSITSATSSVFMSVKHHSVPTTSSITSTISSAFMLAREGVAKPHSNLSSNVPSTSSIKSATSSVFMSVKHPSVPTTSSITTTIPSASMLARRGQSGSGKSARFSDTLQFANTQDKPVGNLPSSSIRQDTIPGNAKEKNRGKAEQPIKTPATETFVRTTIDSKALSQKPPTSTGINPAHPIPQSRTTQPTVLRPPLEALPASLLNKPSIPVWEDFLKVVLKWSPKWFEEADLERNKGQPPEVAMGWMNQKRPELFPLVERYQSFEDYSQQFMLPLLLYETWARCHRDWVRKKDAKKAVQHKMMINCIEAPSELLQSFVMLGLTTRHARASGQVINRSDLVLLSMRVKAPENNEEASEQQVMAMVERITYEEKKQVVDSVCNLRPDLAACRQEDTVVQQVSVKVRNRNLIPVKTVLHQIQVVSSLVTPECAIQALRKFPGNPLYRHLLFPTCNDTFFNQAKVIPAQTRGHYNTSQLQAINTVGKMLQVGGNRPQMCLIQGPPGTGKSHTIIGIIKRLIKDRPGDLRICLCTPSNAAVDELVRRLIRRGRNKESTDQVSVIRLGRKTSLAAGLQDCSLEMAAWRTWLQDSIPVSLNEEKEALVKRIQILSEKMEKSTDKNQKAKYCDDIHTLEKQIDDISKKLKKLAGLAQDGKYYVTALQQTTVIAGTLSNMADDNIRLLHRELAAAKKGPLFHCVIIDEATHGIELDTLIPLQYGTPKLVLVGDPEQLVPTVLSQKCQDNRFNMSLFERLDSYFRYSAKENPVLLLDTQYRMHPQIAHFSNNYVYEGRIKTDSSLSARPKYPLLPYLLYDIDGTQRSKSTSCSEEAIFTARLCRFIVDRAGIRPESIGIIDLYSNQKADIQAQLRQRHLENVEVSTVDGFQGQERDVIILSCVRARTRAEGLGFVDNRNRINVALTRARHAMYILGHLDCLEVNNEWKALIDDAKERKVIVPVLEQSPKRALQKCLNT